MSDKEFLEYNVDNIFKNLLQAEYHAKNIVGGRVNPPDLSCINKHLAFVEGEAEEAVAHCIVGEPGLCDFFNGFLAKIRKLRKRIKTEGAGPELQHEIRALRKEIEGRFKEYDTSECKVCKINPVELKNKLEGKEVPKMKISEELDKKIREEIRTKPEAIPAILSIIADEAYDIASHVASNWQDYAGAKLIEKFAKRCDNLVSDAEELFGDPVPPEEIERLRRKGFEIKPNPICVIAKEAKGKSKEEAEKECLAEGKVHPISLCVAEMKERGILK